MSKLSTLAGLFSLDHNLRLYVPGTANVNREDADLQAAMVLRTMERFADWFGGATGYEAMGAWKSPTAGLIVEKVKIVEAYATTEQVEEHLGDVLAFAQTMRREMGQEVIALEYDNRLYFIE